MKVSGFTFIRNAVKFDYPVIESITSILPLCDEVIVAVGNSSDETLKLIKSIDSGKIKIIETIWNDKLNQGGAVLADETNKALKAVSPDSDWAFYIQADEVIHEDDIEIIKDGMLKWKDDKKVEGLIFKYNHFYGSYHYIGDSRRWYRNEIRIIKNTGDIVSYRDAQGFRKTNGNILKVKPINARIFHYGWVKSPAVQQEKILEFKGFHQQEKPSEKLKKTVEFDYSKIDSLQTFEGSHPEVMTDRINSFDNHFKYNPEERTFKSFRHSLLYFIEKLTGYRVGEYQNYKVI